MNENQYSSWMLERLGIGDAVRLRVGNTTLGRHSTSNIRVLVANYVSRHHAIFRVSGNDETVSLQDVSSNGIFVNGQRYDKVTVQLKNNDIIGIGVSPTDLEDDTDVITLPIYQIKFAPIRKVQVPNISKHPPAQKSKLTHEANTACKTENDIKKESNSSVDGKDQKPCSSKNVMLLNMEEIFEISDDDENENDVAKKSNDNQKKLFTDLNKQIDLVLKSEPFDDKNYINPSQKHQEEKTDNVMLAAQETKDEGFNVKPLQKSPNHQSFTKNLKDVKEIYLDKATTSSNSLENKEEKDNIIHVPILPNIKREQLRTVSENIQNIFGDIDDDDIQRKIREINPLVYNEMKASKNVQPLNGEEKLLKNGDLVILTDDEDFDEVEVEDLGTIIPNNTENETSNKEESAKELDSKEMATTTSIKKVSVEEDSMIESPNIFDSSLDNSIEEPIIVEGNEKNLVQNASNNFDNIDLDKYTKYIPNSDDEDIEDLMFSQVIINDMKAELQDDVNSQENFNPLPNGNLDSQVSSCLSKVGNTVIIKQEPGTEVFLQVPKEIENSCWIISDDEDYDEELETKVNDWSNKIFSQSFSAFSQNMSQVYEIENTDKNDGSEEEDDDYLEEDSFNLLEDDIEGIANIYNSRADPNVEKLKTFSDEIKKNEDQELNEINNKSKQEIITETENIKDINLRVDILKSMDIEQKIIEEKSREQVSPSKTTLYIDQESPVVRKRISSKSKPVIHSSSSSEDELLIKNNVDEKLKTFNDEIKNNEDQELKKTNYKPKTEVIIAAEKIKDNDLPVDMLDGMEIEQIMIKEKSPSKTTVLNDEESPVVRKRLLSKGKPVIDSSSSSSEEELFIQNEQIPNSTVDCKADKPITWLIPPVIDAPLLPKHKGKLRGVSAELPKSKLDTNLKPVSINKSIKNVKEKIRQEQYIKDLKAKWLEKPSVAKKREKERKKLIKERRSDLLKELADRKKEISKKAVKRKMPADGNEPKVKVAKVKVTTRNRGAFLANDDETPRPPPAAHDKKTQQVNQFKIPKIINKTDEHKKVNDKTDSNKNFRSRSLSVDCTRNRGAFLANNVETPPPPTAAHDQKTEQVNQFKIPKIIKKIDEHKKLNDKTDSNKNFRSRSISVDCNETFSQQISKPDILLYEKANAEIKNCKSSNPLRRYSTTEPIKRPTQSNLQRSDIPPPASAICKEAIAARAVRTTNKITFASMEKNIVESEENKRKLNALTANQIAVSTIPTTKKVVKKVRFNDTPIIHYIDRVTGACKKIIHKDIMPMTTYKDRRHLIRSAYPLIDHTDRIISIILCWSNEWLLKCNAAADAASDVIYPMPTQFSSFENYKSIIFPLMKLEFVSTLEREYNVTKNIKKFKVFLEYTTHNKDRIMLITKFNCSNQSKELSDSILYDLVLLEPDKRGPQTFAYVSANRKLGGSCTTIVYEIIGKNVTVENFKGVKELNIRPVMDKVRVHFGALHSVYQLESTPLFPKIINPLEILKCKPPPKRKVNYRGFDQLNDKQKEVLLNTYMKIIDESTPNISLIQGPPGTGKSLVITNLVLQSLYGEEVRYLDKKILVCAQSNAAVDVIASKLYDISMRMRTEKRFRLIRYGMKNKMHASVLPISLHKVVQNDQLKKLQAKNKNIQLENKENLKNQILQFEAQVAEMSSRNIKGTVEEDVLIEKKRQLQLMRNILNESMRPEDERSLFTWYLCNANVICATLSSCVNLSQYTNFFDICIIDEATQCTEPWTLLPLKFGINSLVLVGDTQQLPATVLSKKAHELGLGTSMFTRIQQCLDSIPCTSADGTKANNTTPNNIIYGLQTQYRMHPEICRWPNQYFYRNELINDKSTIDFNKSPLVPFSILSLSYTQNNAGINGKITNDLEAEFVAKLLKALDGFIPNKYNSYGVITPYAHHRATLESAIRSFGLTNIMINTIDSYQGLEKNVIVISNARTNGIGFLSNPQRLNVALTRSRKCLILCGNFKNLESVPVWRCLLENARERKLYHEISANCIEDIQRNVIDKIKVKAQK